MRNCVSRTASGVRVGGLDILHVDSGRREVDIALHQFVGVRCGDHCTVPNGLGRHWSISACPNWRSKGSLTTFDKKEGRKEQARIECGKLAIVTQEGSGTDLAGLLPLQRPRGEGKLHRRRAIGWRWVFPIPCWYSSHAAPGYYLRDIPMHQPHINRISSPMVFIKFWTFFMCEGG